MFGTNTDAGLGTLSRALTRICEPAWTQCEGVAPTMQVTLYEYTLIYMHMCIMFIPSSVGRKDPFVGVTFFRDNYKISSASQYLP